MASALVLAPPARPQATRQMLQIIVARDARDTGRDRSCADWERKDVGGTSDDLRTRQSPTGGGGVCLPERWPGSPDGVREPSALVTVWRSLCRCPVTPWRMSRPAHTVRGRRD